MTPSGIPLSLTVASYALKNGFFMKPRLLFLNRSYWPDTEATGQLLTVLCEGLTDQFEVHVLAGQPNVASTEEGWQETDERNGVTIH
ncbi:MAG: hypothetical protein ABGZ35_06825, partial [Planctomycetaceae bacterium]